MANDIPLRTFVWKINTYYTFLCYSQNPRSRQNKLNIETEPGRTNETANVS